MTSRRRRVGFRVAAVLFSLASFTFPTLGIVDLISGFAPEALPGQAKLLQASYGLLASIITVGFISQVREPELRPAGLQQVATTLLAIAAAGLLGFNLLAFFGVVLIGVFLGILVILHPDRGRLVVLPEPPLGRLPALLALVGTVPGTIYTWQTTNEPVFPPMRISPWDCWGGPRRRRAPSPSCSALCWLPRAPAGGGFRRGAPAQWGCCSGSIRYGTRLSRAVSARWAGW